MKIKNEKLLSDLFDKLSVYIENETDLVFNEIDLYEQNKKISFVVPHEDPNEDYYIASYDKVNRGVSFNGEEGHLSIDLAIEILKFFCGESSFGDEKGCERTNEKNMKEFVADGVKIKDGKLLKEIENDITLFSKEELDVEEGISFYHLNDDIGFASIPVDMIFVALDYKTKEVWFHDEIEYPLLLILKTLVFLRDQMRFMKRDHRYL